MFFLVLRRRAAAVQARQTGDFLPAAALRQAALQALLGGTLLGLLRRLAAFGLQLGNFGADLRHHR